MYSLAYSRCLINVAPFSSPVLCINETKTTVAWLVRRWWGILIGIHLVANQMKLSIFPHISLLNCSQATRESQRQWGKLERALSHGASALSTAAARWWPVIRNPLARASLPMLLPIPKKCRAAKHLCNTGSWVWQHAAESLRKPRQKHPNHPSWESLSSCCCHATVIPLEHS